MMKPNKTKISTIAIAVCAVLSAAIAGCNNDNNKTSSSTPVKDNAYYKSIAESLVAKMTTDEQLSMLAGPGYALSSAGFGVNYDALVNLKNDVPGSVGYINGVRSFKFEVRHSLTIFTDIFLWGFKSKYFPWSRV